MTTTSILISANEITSAGAPCYFSKVINPKIAPSSVELTLTVALNLAIYPPARFTIKGFSIILSSPVVVNSTVIF